MAGRGKAGELRNGYIYPGPYSSVTGILIMAEPMPALDSLNELMKEYGQSEAASAAELHDRDSFTGKQRIIVLK